MSIHGASFRATCAHCPFTTAALCDGSTFEAARQHEAANDSHRVTVWDGPTSQMPRTIWQGAAREVPALDKQVVHVRGRRFAALVNSGVDMAEFDRALAALGIELVIDEPTDTTGETR